MNSNLGIMQGRLLPKVNQRIQAFPGEDWSKELEKANFIGIKNLEWTFDHEKLFENPILDFKMINQIVRIIRIYHIFLIILIQLNYLLYFSITNLNILFLFI